MYVKYVNQYTHEIRLHLCSRGEKNILKFAELFGNYCSFANNNCLPRERGYTHVNSFSHINKLKWSNRISKTNNTNDFIFINNITRIFKLQRVMILFTDEKHEHDNMVDLYDQKIKRKPTDIQKHFIASHQKVKPLKSKRFYFCHFCTIGRWKESVSETEKVRVTHWISFWKNSLIFLSSVFECLLNAHHGWFFLSIHFIAFVSRWIDWIWLFNATLVRYSQFNHKLHRYINKQMVRFNFYWIKLDEEISWLPQCIDSKFITEFQFNLHRGDFFFT